VGIRHTYSSTCKLCKEQKTINTIVYGDYDGNEGEGSTHEPEECKKCQVLKEEKTPSFNLALKYYKKCRKVEQKMEKKHQKDKDENYVCLTMLRSKLKQNSEISEKSLKKRIDELLAISNDMQDPWVLGQIISYIQEDSLLAMTKNTP
jgi:hypothetical protein